MRPMKSRSRRYHVKSVKLEGTDTTKVDKSPMRDLKGGFFNEAYLADQVQGHKEALSEFERARGQFKEPFLDMDLYVEQTIPVLQAHLKMAAESEAARRRSKHGKSG